MALWRCWVLALVASALHCAAGVRVSGGAGGGGRRGSVLSLVFFEEEAPATALLSELVVGVLGRVPAPPRVAWSPGSKGVAVFHPDQTQAPVVLADRGGGAVVGLKFFPNADRLLTVAYAGLHAIWDAGTGRALHELKQCFGEGARTPEAQVLPDGERVITVDADGSAALWSAASGQVLQRFPGHHNDLRLFPGGDSLAATIANASERPRAVVIWSLAGRGALREFRQPDGAIDLMEVSPCGAKVVTAGSGGVFVWTAATAQLDRALSWHGRVRGLGVSAGAAHVVGSAPGRLLVWEGGAGRLRQRLETGGVLAPRFALLAGGRLVAVTHADAAVWDMDSGRRLVSLDRVWGEGAIHLAASPCGRIVAACGTPLLYASALNREDTAAWLAVWDTATGRSLHATQAADDDLWHFHWPCSVAVGPMASMAEVLLG